MKCSLRGSVHFILLCSYVGLSLMSRDEVSSGSLESVGSGFHGQDSGNSSKTAFIPTVFFLDQSNCTDSCQNPPVNSTGWQNCYCDSACEVYGDCCYDYNFTGTTLGLDLPLESECVKVHRITERFVLYISSCPASYYDRMDRVKLLTAAQCRLNQEQSPLVTDLSTNVTYKNVYCAQCNGIFEAQPWVCPFKGICEEPFDSDVRECFPGEIVEQCPHYEDLGRYHSEPVSHTEYSFWASQCNKYQRLVNASDAIYRNEYCTLCYGERFVDLVCRESSFIDVTLFLDTFVPEVSPCHPGEKFNERLHECQSAIRIEDHFNCSSLVASCDCDSLVTLNATEFEYINEDVVLFDGLNFEIQLNTTEGLPVICSNFSHGQHFLEYPAGYELITYIGSSLSIFGCSLVFLTFCLFKELRTFPAKLILNIATVVAVTNSLTVLTVSEAIGGNSALCQTVAIVLHFFVLCEFSWMTILCIEVCRSFYHANRLIPVRREGLKWKLVFYSILAWSIPLVIVAISVIVNFTSQTLVDYGTNPERGERLCWIVHFNSAVVAFLVPVVALIFMQLILFMVGGFFLILSSKKKVRSGRSEDSVPYLRVFFAMFFSSNLLWVFGFIALGTGYLWAWYPYLILISTQGFAIFFAFYGTKKVWLLYIAKFSKFKDYVLSSRWVILFKAY